MLDIDFYLFLIITILTFIDYNLLPDSQHILFLSACPPFDRYDPEFLVWNQNQAEQRMTK